MSLSAAFVGCVMDREFYSGFAQRVRDLAEKADPSTRKRLMELAGRYDALAGNPSRVSRMIERPLPLPRVVPGYGQSGEA
jgi:hypothetical protein